ncbi:MAG: S8/S53 family peptidase [Desulfurococcaceae archaeon]
MRYICRKDFFDKIREPYIVIRELGRVVVIESDVKQDRDVCVEDSTVSTNSIPMFQKYRYRYEEYEVEAFPYVSIYPDEVLRIHNFRDIYLELSKGYFFKNICVIDSGVNDHLVFRENTVSIERINYVEDESESDEYGHGTSVAGLISMFAPYSRIISVKIINRKGVGKVSDFLFALHDCLKNFCLFINISLGGYLDENIIEMVESEIDYIRSNLIRYKLDLFIVTSSGNEANINKVTYPCGSRNSICVGSINKYLYRSWFSNVDINSLKPDFVTYGECVLTSDPGVYDKLICKTGTSFSTPIVTGVLYQIVNSFVGTYTSPIVILPIRVVDRESVYSILFSNTYKPRLLFKLFYRGRWDPNYGYGIPYLP